MRCAPPTRLAILLLLTSFVSGCAATGAVPDLAPKAAVRLPPPPAFMGSCPDSGVAAGMPPNQAFDLEHAARKSCDRNGAAARIWYLNVRKRYGAAKL